MHLGEKKEAENHPAGKLSPHAADTEARATVWESSLQENFIKSANNFVIQYHNCSCKYKNNKIEAYIRSCNIYSIHVA
jgi:hypothetical protein